MIWSWERHKIIDTGFIASFADQYFDASSSIRSNFIVKVICDDMIMSPSCVSKRSNIIIYCFSNRNPRYCMGDKAFFDSRHSLSRCFGPIGSSVIRVVVCLSKLSLPQSTLETSTLADKLSIIQDHCLLYFYQIFIQIFLNIHTPIYTIY